MAILASCHLGTHSPPVHYRDLLGLIKRDFTGQISFVLAATQPSVSKHRKEHKELTQITGLASSFIHPQAIKLINNQNCDVKVLLYLYWP